MTEFQYRSRSSFDWLQRSLQTRLRYELEKPEWWDQNPRAQKYNLEWAIQMELFPEPKPSADEPENT